MHDNHILFKSVKLFFTYKPGRMLLLFLITLLQGFSQGIGLMLLIPMLSMLDASNAAGSTNKWIEILNTLLRKTGTEPSLTAILLLFTICMLTVAILNYFHSVLQSTYQQGFSFEIRRRLFRKIIGSDWEFLNGKSKHVHIQVLTSEIPKMSLYYYYYLGLTGKLLFITTHLVLAFLLSPTFTLLIVVSGGLVSLSLRRYLNKADSLGKANIQLFRKLIKRIDDFWSTVKIAKVHHSEDFYVKKYDETNRQMLEYQNRQVKNRTIPQLLFSVAGILILVLVVYTGVSVIQMPLASLFILILLFGRIFPQIAGMNNDLNMMISNKGSVNMVLSVDRDLPDPVFQKETIDTVPIQIQHQIEIKHLNFSFNPDEPLFKDFSATFNVHTITGITGKSGRGKTTLLDIVAGLEKTEKTVIYVDGKPLDTAHSSEWKQAIGYLPQDSFFIDGTLRENIVWDCRHQTDDATILHILRQVNAEQLVLRQANGLDTYIANYPYHFSGGERQRLALARVLLRRPQLLLLDEATASLDSENEQEIIQLLLKVKHETTVLFITHRKELIPYFDRIVDLDLLPKENRRKP